MKTFTAFRGQATLQDQINRLFNDTFERTGQESNLTTWAPAVDIHENEHELVVNADLPGAEGKDLTIRGERRFEKQVNEDNYLRVERAYGSFSRSFSLANTVNPDGIKADYQNGVLTLNVPKREEAKPKQIKVTVGTFNGASTGTPAVAAAATAGAK